MTTYLTTAELAARWRVTSGHLRNLRSAGRGPRWTRPGRDVLYALDSVEELEVSGQGAQLACPSCRTSQPKIASLEATVQELRRESADRAREIALHKRMNRTMGDVIDQLRADLEIKRA